jgi:hypothetical protein
VGRSLIAGALNTLFSFYQFPQNCGSIDIEKFSAMRKKTSSAHSSGQETSTVTVIGKNIVIKGYRLYK